jgi:hypothetical protein
MLYKKIQHTQILTRPHSFINRIQYTVLNIHGK